MYQAYWGFKEKPFENVADPHFLYYSRQHEEALTRLMYVVSEAKGLAVLTGVFGCGKTVVARTLISSLSKGRYEVAFLINPQFNSVELLRDIVYHLGVKDNLPSQKTDILHALDGILRNNFNDGKSTVIIIDEAHLIEDKMIFEELRLLLNFQAGNHFLLTLILIGQPELREKINNIKQLEQRIAMKYHLSGLTLEDTLHYIRHRLKVAGAEQEIFGDEAIRLIQDFSGGIPRRINHICDNALLVASARQMPAVSPDLVSEVVEDMQR